MQKRHTRPSGILDRPLTRIAAAALLVASCSLPVRETSAADIGTSAGSFLEFEVGAGAAGMAGAQTGIASGITGQYWNPAAVAGVGSPQVGVMHATWLQDLRYEWIGYAHPISPRWGVGSVSVAYFHLPSIDAVDEFNNPAGQFKVYDLALTAGYSRPVTSAFSVGANAKYIRQSIADVSASGVAADFGATARFAGTTLGASVLNLGPGLSFGGASYPLPQQVRLGVGKQIYGGRILLAADYNIPRDYYRDLRVGTEVRPYSVLALRAGYRHEFAVGNDPATGLSFGVGFNLSQLSLDYALTPSSQFDDVHRVSLGYSFGSGAREPDAPPARREEKKPAPPPPAPVGPPVIAAVKSAQVKTPKVVLGPPAAPSKAAPPAVAVAPPAAAAKAPAPVPVPKSSASGSAAPTEFAVVLPGYHTKESAQAEIQALELLGFSAKHAQIVANPKGSGFFITLVRMKSKGKADDLVASLSKMSFRAIVEVVVR